MSIARTLTPGIRPFQRAVATSQGHHFAGIHASINGAEMLELQEAHDVVSDGYFKRADDELMVALDSTDPRAIKNHIRVSMSYRDEGYRFEALEDERRHQAQAHMTEAREANLAGSRVCDDVLRRDSVCSHGEAA